MTNFSKKIHCYFGLFIPGVYLSLFLGGIIIASDKTYIGKHALFMMQKMEKRLYKSLRLFKALWHVSEEILIQKSITDNFCLRIFRGALSVENKIFIFDR